jgi:ABC-type antimicrobial peptide transport system permease subunit
MVFISICIALPLSYLIAWNWLDSFAFKINLEWWYFVGAALLTIIIALLTVSLQSINAAAANPVKCLRAE